MDYMNKKGIERLKLEYNEIKNEESLKENLGFFDLTLINNDYKHWKVCIPGPKSSPYQNGILY